MLDNQFGSFSRRNAFNGVIAIVMIIFLARLYQLQLVEQIEYGKKSEENSIQPITKEPIRGFLFDRNGTLIVDSRPSYTLTITPHEYNDRNTDFLASILRVSPDYIRDRVRRGRQYSVFQPVKVLRDLDFHTISIFEENREHLPGVDYIVESKRFYTTRAHASHLLGYTKEISDRQLSETGGYYKQGDVIGSVGIESSYEQLLRGEKGVEYMLRNARGQLIGNYEEGKHDIPSKDGFDLYLSFDSNLQTVAESLLVGKRGSVVAIDPQNGELLAVASSPDFDPADFSGVTPAELWHKLNDDPDVPLYNRATLTRYPPGSTFKMVLATAAINEGIINTEWTANCPGSFRFGNKVFKCSHGRAHGRVNITRAIQVSCNVFFYNLMLKVGLDRWSKYATMFGFGQTTGIDIPEENPGLVPSTQYYDHVYGKGGWTQGYLVSLGIGQGEVGVTPLQMAIYASELANEGQFFQPHAVRAVKIKRTGRIDSIQYISRMMDVQKTTWDIVRNGMRLAVLPGGTGMAARIPGIEIAGKTGTAQNPHGKDHAWFIGFAPYENPKIAVAVIIENAGYGGTEAAPIAGRVMEQYLYGEIIRDNPQKMQSITGSTPITTEKALKNKPVGLLNH
ncbi:MAG: penicillin-binding protein 2 [Bacteroidota bacterium]